MGLLNRPVVVEKPQQVEKLPKATDKPRQGKNRRQPIENPRQAKREQPSVKTRSGKKRKLRGVSVARVEERLGQNIEATLPQLGLLEGQCKSNACGGPEFACKPHSNGTYSCVCTSNGELPTDDFKCPRSTVPLSPQPIHNIIPPIQGTDSRSPTAQSPNSLLSAETFSEATAKDYPVLGPEFHTNQGANLILAAGSIGIVLILLTIVFYLRKRICLVNGKSQTRMRPGEPLLADRYITNPQYGVCGANLGAANLEQNKAEENEHPVQHLDRNALMFLEEVGEGCFGKVHKGLLKTSSGEQVVAIKVLKESASRSAEEDFAREVNIMSAFRHPNILSLVGVVYRDDINASPWMVFEYMEWGDLAGVLRGSRGGGRTAPALDDVALLAVALQVAQGMQYLASQRFVHRDLAARNCLVGARLAVKIADFGMSRDVYTCDYYKMGGERPMPVRWMSPESILYARFTHESDVWSYGVVLWEIYSRGKQPFYGHNNDGATKMILQGIVLVPPEDCPGFACELMRSCWKTDPHERISFDEICKKLEVAVTAGDTRKSATTTRLPRPPPPPQDSAGYLVPALAVPADYMAPIPDSSSSSSSSSCSEDEEEDDEYT